VAETEFSAASRLSVDTIWDFVKEMDNWAPFLTGYQSHEKQSETDSLWTLKGDVGVLARTVRFRVHITEWNGPERVSFEFEGVNELLKGQGMFSVEAFEKQGPGRVAWKKNLFGRMLEGIVRFFLGLAHGNSARRSSSGAGPGYARLTFKLRVDPGGPMAPMVNAMMKPAMGMAAEDLSNKIMAHLEARHESEA